MHKLSALIVAFCILGTSGLAAADAAGSVARGRETYLRTGCWQCHGYVGQGGGGATKLAPEVMPVEAMIAFVRGSTKNMPAYGEKILSDADLTDIHAFLESLPAPKAPDGIALLRNLKPPQ